MVHVKDAVIFHEAMAEQARIKENKAYDEAKTRSEEEQKIEECDGDLREASVQRTKMSGKDRFCNRYYWRQMQADA